jgi:hypothetical protein
MSDAKKGADCEFEFLISKRRIQAIREDALVDVSTLAKETGFTYPVAITAALWADINDTMHVGQKRHYAVKLVCGPGDKAEEPVITLMRSDED